MARSRIRGGRGEEESCLPPGHLAGDTQRDAETRQRMPWTWTRGGGLGLAAPQGRPSEAHGCSVDNAGGRQMREPRSRGSVRRLRGACRSAHGETGLRRAHPHPRASRDTVGTPQPPQGPRGAPGGRVAGTGRHDPEGGRDKADATPPCQGSKDTHCCLLSVKCRSTLSWKPTSLSASSTCERDKVQGTSGRRVPSEGKARPLLPRAEERNLRDLRCERNSPGNPDYTLDRRRRFKWSNLGKV